MDIKHRIHAFLRLLDVDAVLVKMLMRCAAVLSAIPQRPLAKPQRGGACLPHRMWRSGIRARG